MNKNIITLEAIKNLKREFDYKRHFKAKTEAQEAFERLIKLYLILDIQEITEKLKEIENLK